ncbi:hypothetical protein HDU76_000873 [Blyttiomyces sp. JEL0837]|nr:hypothetical protein HDU76_000873 [Blyttiomyces sp. JEL0837]
MAQPVIVTHLSSQSQAGSLTSPAGKSPVVDKNRAAGKACIYDHLNIDSFTGLVTVIRIALDDDHLTPLAVNPKIQDTAYQHSGSNKNEEEDEDGIYHIAVRAPGSHHNDMRDILSALGLSKDTNAALVVFDGETGKVVRQFDDLDANPDRRILSLERFVEGEGSNFYP